MSLLNEMLHDLAKQKSSRQLPPKLNPASSSSKNARRAIIILCGFALMLFGLTVLLINRTTALNTVTVAENKQVIRNNVPKIDVVAGSEVNSLPTEHINVSSYIEPLSSLASLRVALQYPAFEEEPVNEWVDTQDEIQNEPITESVNKVYPPLTLEEWHDAQFNKALKAIDDGFDVRAVEILEAILVKMPGAVDVRENLASLYLSFGDYARTTRTVTEGLKYSPSDAALITIKARLLLDQGKSEEAIKLLSGFRPTLSSYPDFYATLAAALQSEGRVMEAGSLYKSLIQVDPDNGQYWLGYGISLEHNHKSNQAIQAYVKAIQNPDSDPSVRSYAEIRLKTLQG
jgi:MSHA biogenesis protein MshN